jgi:hypothetical protein
MILTRVSSPRSSWPSAPKSSKSPKSRYRFAPLAARVGLTQSLAKACSRISNNPTAVLRASGTRSWFYALAFWALAERICCMY